MNLHFIDIFFSCLLAFAILLGSLLSSSSLMGAVIFFIIGVSFIFSKKLQGNLLFFKIIFWISDNVFKPKTSLNYMIWGGFLIFVGLIILFSSPPDLREKEFLDGLLMKLDFWIGVFLVLLFNAIIGFYTVINKKKKSQ